jgi:hypothetical protein
MMTASVFSIDMTFDPRFNAGGQLEQAAVISSCPAEPGAQFGKKKIIRDWLGGHTFPKSRATRSYGTLAATIMGEP